MNDTVGPEDITKRCDRDSECGKVRYWHWTVPLLLSVAVAACVGTNDGSAPRVQDVSLTVRSSRPDMVSGNSARIGIALPAGTPAGAVKLKVNGVEVPAALRRSADAPSYEALVDGLKAGTNEVVAETSGTSRARASLALTSYPGTGPIFSGPHRTPFECRTEESGLGAALDRDCSVAVRYDWFYFTPSGARLPLTDPFGPRPADMAVTTTSDGKEVPFIVRVESGTLNRSIYRIAVLDDPAAPGQWNPAGWNRRVILRFGESTGAQYNQGFNNVTDVFRTSATDSQSITALGKGFAYVVSTQNTNGVNVDDALAAETAMMLREHIVKTHGALRWMLGMGGSGGAIQQMLIAQNYPGILDGIMPDAAFADVFSTAMSVSDCRLLNRYFQRHPASDAVRRAVEGHTKGTCANWDSGLGDAIVATSGAVSPACGLKDTFLVYKPTTNPTGTRCSIYDINANSLGRNPQGKVNRPLDNVGVQYGLDALRKGVITVDEFLDLNEKIGGYDEDGNLDAARTVAEPEGLRRAYQSGRVGTGGGGLGIVPIMHARLYAEPAGDIHTINNDIKIREQLIRSNGQANNQVIWVLPHPNQARLPGLGASQQQVLAQLARDTLNARLDLMTRWLDALSADPAPLSAEKVARTKPAGAVDSCWDAASAQRLPEPATFADSGTCNSLYPKTSTPRMQAGAPIIDDVLKCRLKPIDASDYLPAVLGTMQRQRLLGVFPQGVCDFTKPGVGQAPLQSTWQRF